MKKCKLFKKKSVIKGVITFYTMEFIEEFNLTCERQIISKIDFYNKEVAYKAWTKLIKFLNEDFKILADFAKQPNYNSEYGLAAKELNTVKLFYKLVCEYRSNEMLDSFLFDHLSLLKEVIEIYIFHIYSTGSASCYDENHNLRMIEILHVYFTNNDTYLGKYQSKVACYAEFLYSAMAYVNEYSVVLLK